MDGSLSVTQIIVFGLFILSSVLCVVAILLKNFDGDKLSLLTRKKVLSGGSSYQAVRIVNIFLFVSLVFFGIMLGSIILWKPF